MASQTPSEILDGIAAARVAFEKNEAGSREALIDYSRALISSLEIPSEFVQRTFWAEVITSRILMISHGLSSEADKKVLIACPIRDYPPRRRCKAFPTPEGSWSTWIEPLGSFREDRN